MYCKSINKTGYWLFLIAIGAISLLFGAVSAQKVPEDAHDLSMLMGMFSGLGGAFMAIGIFRLVYVKIAPPAKLKQKEIDRNDERNVQILRIAYTIACITATMLFAIMAFVFVYLGYRVPAFISIGALYVQILAFFFAHMYYNKKM